MLRPFLFGLLSLACFIGALLLLVFGVFGIMGAVVLGVLSLIFGVLAIIFALGFIIKLGFIAAIIFVAIYMLGGIPDNMRFWDSNPRLGDASYESIGDVTLITIPIKGNVSKVCEVTAEQAEEPLNESINGSNVVVLNPSRDVNMTVQINGGTECKVLLDSRNYIYIPSR
jgi:hypothetical protein